MRWVVAVVVAVAHGALSLFSARPLTHEGDESPWEAVGRDWRRQGDGSVDALRPTCLHTYQGELSERASPFLTTAEAPLGTCSRFICDVPLPSPHRAVRLGAWYITCSQAKIRATAQQGEQKGEPLSRPRGWPDGQDIFAQNLSPMTQKSQLLDSRPTLPSQHDCTDRRCEIALAHHLRA